MAITPTQFAKKTVQCKILSYPIALQSFLTGRQRPIGPTRSAESCLPTANGSEECVPQPSYEPKTHRNDAYDVSRRNLNEGTDTGIQAPEIQTMYNMPMPISAIRTRIRQEFERQRYVSKLPIVDVLLFKGNAEYQV